MTDLHPSSTHAFNRFAVENLRISKSKTQICQGLNIISLIKRNHKYRELPRPHYNNLIFNKTVPQQKDNP